MIITPMNYDRYRVPAQILMERAHVEEGDVMEIDLRTCGLAVLTLIARDSDGFPTVGDGEILTKMVAVPW